MSKTALQTEAGFEAFYDRHWKYVFRLCFTYMKNEAEAEDCTEDVFVKVLSGGLTFHDELHERKWLTVAAANLCKDRLRSTSRRNVLSIDDEKTPEIAASDKEDHSEVLDAVLQLPAKYKDVVWLFYYEGYPSDEIADILKRPPSTVRNQLKDARNLLKKKLGGDCL